MIARKKTTMKQTTTTLPRTTTSTTTTTTDSTTTTSLPELSYPTEAILYPINNYILNESTTDPTTTAKLITAQSIANNTSPLAALVPSLSLLVNSSLTPPSGAVGGSIAKDDWDKVNNDCADSDIFEQIAIGAVCILFQILLMMGYRLHRKSINLKQKTLLQLLIVMLRKYIFRPRPPIPDIFFSIHRNDFNIYGFQ